VGEIHALGIRIPNLDNYAAIVEGSQGFCSYQQSAVSSQQEKTNPKSEIPNPKFTLGISLSP
jgi:hypothetical protein